MHSSYQYKFKFLIFSFVVVSFVLAPLFWGGTAVAEVRVGNDITQILYPSASVVPCKEDAKVLCGFDVYSRDGGREGGYAEERRVIKVPAGTVTVASKFKTEKTGQNGVVNLHYGTYDYDQPIEMWFSEKPGGQPAAPNCKWASYSVTTHRWVVGMPYQHNCQLKPDTLYYINMKHEKEGAEDSAKLRWVRGSYMPGYPKEDAQTTVQPSTTKPENIDNGPLSKLKPALQFFLKQPANAEMKKRILDNPKVLDYLVRHELRQTELQSFTTDLDAIFKHAGVKETAATTNPNTSKPNLVADAPASATTCRTLDNQNLPDGWSGVVYIKNALSCMASCEDYAVQARCQQGKLEDCRGGSCRPFNVQVQLGDGPSFGPVRNNYASAQANGYASCSLNPCRDCTFADGSVPHGWSGPGYSQPKGCGQCQARRQMECVDGRLSGDQGLKTYQYCQPLNQCSWQHNGTQVVDYTLLHLGGTNTCTGSQPPSGQCSAYGDVCVIRDFERNTTQKNGRPAATLETWRCGE